MTPAHPPAFEAFVRPARARPQLWRLVLGVGLCALVYTGLFFVIVAAAGGLIGTDGMLRNAAAAATPTGTLVLLATFLGMALGPMLAVRLLHHRRVGTLFGHAPRVIRDFTTAAGIAVVVYAASIAIWLGFFEAIPRLDPLLWLGLLPLSLAGLALQTGAEELLFRGYLQQQLAARFRSRAVWMFVPSLLFGALHYDPATTGGNAGLIVAATAVFALVAADLTAATGSLGAAWGLHFANNVFAILIVAVDGTLPGLALYTTPYAADETGLLQFLILGDVAILVLTWAILRRALRR